MESNSHLKSKIIRVSNNVLWLVFVMLFLLPHSAIALERTKLMKLPTGPRGVLYALTNQGVERFDFETREQADVFPGLFQGFLRLNYLNYFKNSNGLIFFDSGEKGFLSDDGIFVTANPKTQVINQLFHSNRTFDLNAISYLLDGRGFAFLTGQEGYKLRPGVPLPPDELWVCFFSSGEKIKLADDAAVPGASPLWISDKELLYLNYAGELVQINIETKQRKPWGISHVYPWALSPDGKHILATDMEYSKIYLLNVSLRIINGGHYTPNQNRLKQRLCHLRFQNHVH